MILSDGGNLKAAAEAKLMDCDGSSLVNEDDHVMPGACKAILV